MAGSKTDSQEQIILDYEWRAVAYTPPTNWFVGLYTVAPTDAGGGTEVTGGSYARVSKARGTTHFNRTGSVVSNATLITFPTATASWGTVVAFGLFDASTAGNLKYWADLTTSRAIASGDIAEFAIGDLTITED